MMKTPLNEPTIHDLYSLQGKTALITGASGYLGAAMSRALAEAGAAVIAASRDAARAAACAAALPRPHGAEHLGVVLNHMNEESIRHGFERAVAHTGAVDILVNNGTEGPAADWTDVSAEQFNRQLANATGYFLLARSLRDHAVQRSVPASIVMIGSMYGLVASYPDAYEGICAASPVSYHALKGGVIHMTRHLAVYWAKDRVRVNCLSPGAFPNPDKAPAQLVERLQARCPLGRVGASHELKGAVVFLASEASSYMTGHNLVIDGGWTAW